MSRTGASRRRSIGADDTVELAKFPAPHRGDDDYEVSDNPLPRAPAVDARLVILWLALAVFLVVLVGLAVAVAVQYL